VILTVVKVKICGITTLRAALAAAHAGADALGFVFAPSPRQISPQEAKKLIQALSPFTIKVGVFVNSPIKEVKDIASYCNLDFVQLHGSEPPEYCHLLRQRHKVIKAFQVKNEVSEALINAYPVDAVLLDTYLPARAGGTGESFNWALAQNLKLAQPLILAGGLTPENVGEAITLVNPFAVDVSSGVETNGKKDLTKIYKFIARAKGEKYVSK
jgi:phosphoribosylanthranilate isomerase